MRRASPDVHHNVQHFTLNNTAEFRLRMLYLVVQPAESMANRSRVIILDETISYADLRELELVITLEEKAALVLEHQWLDHADAGKRCLNTFHIVVTPSTFSMSGLLAPGLIRSGAGPWADSALHYGLLRSADTIRPVSRDPRKPPAGAPAPGSAQERLSPPPSIAFLARRALWI